MYTILAVDDNKTNLQVLKSVLGSKYTTLLALSGELALRYAQKREIDLILLDLTMPGMDGRETLRELRKLPSCETTPVVFLTANAEQNTEVECLQLGACDFISKPFAPEILQIRIDRILELETYRKDLQGRLREQTIKLENIVLEAIAAIANTLDAKDEYTKGHSVRVADYAVELAKLKGWQEDECARLHRIALLHDVGKIGVPDSILKKNGPLSENEFDVLRQHTVIGANILKDINTLKYLGVGARSHHEHFDGSGYPEHLKGEDIPEIARIICIADAYDAMTSNRCYRPSLTDAEARQELLKGAGSQFDPELVKLFLTVLDVETNSSSLL